MNNIKNYLDELKKGINNLDQNKILKIESKLLETIKKGNNIFVCGNGGSSAVANHFLCDFNNPLGINSYKFTLKCVPISKSKI